MDPLACFYAWLGAVADGELDLSADAEESYSAWIARGGAPAELPDGSTVLRLDTEQDRFLVCTEDGVERWRSAYSVPREGEA